MNTELVFKKTRLTPTPSGYLHLGNILSFALTAALAAKTNACILLRIDDFDLERTNKLYVQDIFDTLNFLEIPWHEGPRNMRQYENEFSQVHRMHRYENALEQLKETSKVFACTCTRTQVVKKNANNGYPGNCRDKQIPLDTANTSWRLNTAEAKDLVVRTTSGIVQTQLPVSMGDFIVRRKDRVPAYQLISVIDDLYYGIDFVVRGDDLWPSTLAQQYLAQTLGEDAFADITFHHHPLIFGQDGLKLSKSEGATSVHYLREQHTKPADIYGLIGQSLGITDKVSNWAQLADAVKMGT